MPTIARLASVMLYIYADDHAPPHFHARGPNTNCQIAIGALRVIRGSYRAADLAEAIAWAEENRALLREKWSEFNERD